MACYDYTICYIPGRENNYADLLSRIGFEDMIKNATQLWEEKLPEGLTVKLIPGGGDSMVNSLSLQELEWKKEDKKVSKVTQHTEDDTDKLSYERNNSEVEEISDSTENKFWCNHYGKNYSVGIVTFGQTQGIKVCALYDSCASLSMMSSSLAQHLDDQGLLIRDTTENLNITGMGGERLQLSIQYVYASPTITSTWSIQNTRWAVMDDDRIPACVIIGFNFLAQNNIILDYNQMKLCSLIGENTKLGRMHDLKILRNGTAEAVILKRSTFKNEIQIFEEKLPREKISIPSKFLEHFWEDLKNLLDWQENIIQYLYCNKTIYNYNKNTIPVDNLNPSNFVKFQNNVDLNNCEIYYNTVKETISNKISELSKIKELDFYSNLPTFFCKYLQFYD
ncbi:unnamed protein product [Rotaria magnacalcarata]|uniref:Uncharacterized protein n=1 Tax=Rotaria magnacalcarata TaxID=392030 RepID=A0A816QJC2_9BILA|nr:unnamed protein product [Rotaria magnacalcarata]